MEFSLPLHLTINKLDGAIVLLQRVYMLWMYLCSRHRYNYQGVIHSMNQYQIMKRSTNRSTSKFQNIKRKEENTVKNHMLNLINLKTYKLLLLFMSTRHDMNRTFFFALNVQCSVLFNSLWLDSTLLLPLLLWWLSLNVYIWAMQPWCNRNCCCCRCICLSYFYCFSIIKCTKNLIEYWTFNMSSS